MSYRSLSNFSSYQIPSPSSNIRLVARNTHQLNITRKGISAFRIKTWYHSILDYSWGKFFVVLSIGFILVNLLFGALYFLDPDGIDGVIGDRSSHVFFLCFCFSAQTITTIGYGKLSPNSDYVQVLVLIESFASFLISAFLTGIVFSKISRPTRITNTFMCSTVAVLNRETPAYIGGSSLTLEGGKYVAGKYNVLSIRIANTRRSQLCNPQLRLLLLRKENTKEEAKFVMHELEYEIYQQAGRTRAINFSIPYLPLPWTISHTIDEKSPLFHINPRSWTEPENYFEMIVILDGVDEAVSMNIQARWSYIPSEIMTDAKFVEITSRDETKGRYEVDFSKFNDFVFIPPSAIN